MWVVAAERWGVFSGWGELLTLGLVFMLTYRYGICTSHF